MGFTQEESIFFLGIGALETIFRSHHNSRPLLCFRYFLVLLACVGVGFVVCFVTFLFVWLVLVDFLKISTDQHLLTVFPLASILVKKLAQYAEINIELHSNQSIYKTDSETIDLLIYIVFSMSPCSYGINQAFFFPPTLPTWMIHFIMVLTCQIASVYFQGFHSPERKTRSCILTD